jgi:NAD(P)-dependent dehydrogenase (short-subunit alcohol dehydrogenase family)
MDLGLKGKVALVTGGSRGIGYAIAQVLAAEGASVAICGRGEDAVKAAAQALSKETGSRVVGFRADTGDAGDVAALVDATVSELGGLDILVNNAASIGGTGGPDTLAQLNEPLLNSDFQVKMLGYLRCAKAAYPHMEAKGQGRIVNIDGMATRMAAGISGGMRNAAVMNATKVMSEELGPKGITVNAVHPGATLTEALAPRLAGQAEQTGKSVETLMEEMAQGLAIRRLVTATDIANVVAFICSDQAATITGESISVAGGGSKAVFY